MLLYSPIEQFNYIKLCSFSSNFIFFFSIIIMLILLILVPLVDYYYGSTNFTMLTDLKIKNVQTLMLEVRYVPSYVQMLLELFVLNFISAFKNLIPLRNVSFLLNLLLTVIMFIFFSNVLGLIPFTYTITAQIFITLNLALLLFISYNVIGIIKYQFSFVEIFMPSGLSLILNYLLVPIELVSYIFRPISLAIRLFANIMAGHTLLKVICSFIYRFFQMDFTLMLSFIPFFVLGILYGLELFVALIQSYVFFILVCIFLKDIVSISH